MKEKIKEVLIQSTLGISTYDPKMKNLIVNVDEVTQGISELIHDTVKKELESLRPPDLEMSRWLTGKHEYMGSLYSSCIICGFSPEAIDFEIRNRVARYESRDKS